MTTKAHIKLGAIGLTFVPLLVVTAGSLPAPEQHTTAWVPFQAKLERVHTVSGNLIAAGRIMVDSSGSERREVWVGRDGHQRRVIEIRNQSTGRFCRLLADSEREGDPWKCQPMDVLPGPPKLAKGQPGPLLEGFQTQVFRSRSGYELTVAPSLAWHQVITKDESYTTRVFDIEVGPPDPELFVPPAQDVVIELKEKGGRVFQQRAARERPTRSTNN